MHIDIWAFIFILLISIYIYVDVDIHIKLFLHKRRLVSHMKENYFYLFYLQFVYIHIFRVVLSVKRDITITTYIKLIL